MSNDKLIIPKKIKVGFQDRTDTYTQKLAYVVYVDDKGVTRKEKSWLSWSTESIPKQEFNNLPTSGFVLNKGVGGVRQSSGWNARNEYVRVYDPRGFEFEISVANLLFILEECTSTKGKGLEGDFVYSWDKNNLVLLPCSSSNFQESQVFTKLQTMKVSAKDIVAGGIYKTKNAVPVMYLGLHRWYRHNQPYGTHNKNMHVFLRLDKKPKGSWESDEAFALNPDWEDECRYLLFKDFTKIADIVDATPSIGYADEYQKLMETPFVSKVDHFEHEKKQSDQYGYGQNYIFFNGEYYYARFEVPERWRYTYTPDIPGNVVSHCKFSIYKGLIRREDNKSTLMVGLPEKEFKDSWIDLYVVCENGARVKL